MTTKDAIDIIKQTPIYRQEEGKETHSELFEALELAVKILKRELLPRYYITNERGETK